MNLSRYFLSIIAATAWFMSALVCAQSNSFQVYDNSLLTTDKIQFSGRIDFSHVKGPYLSWPGTSIRFKMAGKRLIITLNDEQGLNRFNVIFNRQNSYPYVLAAKKGEHEYDLSHMIKEPITEVEIFKRTEGAEGGTHFVGISLDHNSGLLSLSPKPSRKIIFYGDSVTVGMGNEAAHNAGDADPADKNHYLSYAAFTARNLNAEFHSIAKSGIGFMVSWFDFIMPQYFDQLTAEDNNDSAWDFNQWQPDVVVVNLGQNDSWLIDDQKRLAAKPTEIISAYREFVSQLITRHPGAYFICALGSMDATDQSNSENQWYNYITQAVERLKQDAHQANRQLSIDTLMFEFTGYGAHPRVDQHYDNSQVLTKLIKQKMKWVTP